MTTQTEQRLLIERAKRDGGNSHETTESGPLRVVPVRLDDHHFVVIVPPQKKPRRLDDEDGFEGHYGNLGGLVMTPDQAASFAATLTMIADAARHLNAALRPGEAP